MPQTNLDITYLYLYGIILNEEFQESLLPSFMGIDENPAAVKIYKDLAAIFTPVNAENFSQQQINYMLKNAEWLKEKAFHHNESITRINQDFTVLPMSFCTIFQSEQNLESYLSEQYDDLLKKLNILRGNQEWNLKVFCEEERALDFIVNNNKTVIEMKNKLTTMPKGKQYLMRKKLDQLIKSQLEEQQTAWWNEINHHLHSDIVDSILRRIWGKEITERNDDMIVNCDLLIEKNNTDVFLRKIEEIEKSFNKVGCSFQVTGPWPPYHFSKMEGVKGL